MYYAMEGLGINVMSPDGGGGSSPQIDTSITTGFAMSTPSTEGWVVPGSQDAEGSKESILSQGVGQGVTVPGSSTSFDWSKILTPLANAGSTIGSAYIQSQAVKATGQAQASTAAAQNKQAALMAQSQNQGQRGGSSSSTYMMIGAGLIAVVGVVLLMSPSSKSTE